MTVKNILNKKLIKQRFEKSSLTYLNNAFVQKKMSKELLFKLVEIQGCKFNKILEVGCGTGFLTEEILSGIDFQELFINDIVEQFVNQAAVLSNKIKKVYGDCETISFPSNLDLLIANATFQWVEKLDRVFQKASLNLNSKGILAFSTFGPQNFNQIREITGTSLNYYNQAELETLLSKNFKIKYSDSQIINIEFDTVSEILKHLKLSGVNALKPAKWTKRDLKDFSEKYNKLFKNSDDKLILTYQPLYFIVEKI